MAARCRVKVPGSMTCNNQQNEMNGSHSPLDGTVQWRLGLVNHQSKYLTAETFGFKLNASGVSMRQKQLWILEQDKTEDDVIYIRSHLGRYLSTDKKGNVTACAEAHGAEEKFVVEYNPDSSGRWAFKSKFNTYYLGATEDQVLCYEKAPTNSEWWTPRLAIHPQVSIKNVNRKKYARLSTENVKLQCDQLIPWGPDALITLEFLQGRYALRSRDGRYLHEDGTLETVNNPEGQRKVQFTLEIRSGQQYTGLAFRDSQGRYLTAVGRDAVMQCKNKSVSKDELFTIEDSHPQVFIVAHNGKMVSTKQGVDLTANQDELSDKETFQLEYDRKASQWRLRTCENKYWSLEAASGIQAGGSEMTSKGLFHIDWLDNGQISVRAQNGKYFTARMNGSLYAVSDTVGDKERFYMTIVNRPLLVLKCDFGFVGLKNPTNPRIECNKTAYDYMSLESGDEGSYYIKGPNGLYWSVDGEGMINADSSQPHPFMLELRGQSKMVIKAPNQQYIKGEQNGIFQAKGDLSKATPWEY